MTVALEECLESISKFSDLLLGDTMVVSVSVVESHLTVQSLTLPPAIPFSTLRIMFCKHSERIYLLTGKGGPLVYAVEFIGAETWFPAFEIGIRPW